MRTLLPSLVLGSGLLVYVAACSNDTTAPPPNNGTCAGTPFTLAALEGRTVAAADLPCLTVASDGGTYVVVPQFATADAPLKPVNFRLTAGTASAATANIVVASKRVLPATAATADLGQLQRKFEGMLRRNERSLSAAARASSPGGGPFASRVQADVVPPATAVFKVLSKLTGNSTTLDTAILKYTGSHLLIYQSQNAPVAPNGFTTAQIAAFGNTFDLDLYTIDVATFGAPSDIDHNGRVIVLLSPLVNKLSPASQCATQGYIAGFFDAIDLLPSESGSNDAEIFYAIVPDPAGTFSCTHSVTSVEKITPATFIHEFQHMISFGQHYVIRGGNQEDAWLNEGLSHIAEELGSRYYENRFPSPTGRSDPDQAFPDSSQPFITGDLYNSYHYLLNPASTDANDIASVSNWDKGDGTLVQRGAAWLFLRWLGDQQDSSVYGRLDQTSHTGLDNIQVAAGASYATLFGEFALALYTDSLPGIPRSSIPSVYRFTSRNLRALYAKQKERNPGTNTEAFPIFANMLHPSSTASEAMYPGTMDFFILAAPTSGNDVVLTFGPGSGSSFSSSLGAQVSVFRCPSAAACPSSVH